MSVLFNYLDSSPDNESVPDSNFDPCCPVNNPQNDFADSLDDDDLLDDDLSQIDTSELTLHSGIPHGNSSDLPDLIISSSTDSYDDQEPDSPHSIPERPNRVRFRSRVRIASGLNRHRHSLEGVDYLSTDYSPESIPGSPSSSISVPLRTPIDEQIGKPGWGTLGQRVSLFAKGQMERSRRREQSERLGLGASSFRKEAERGRGEALVIPYYAQITEETPLLLSSARNGSCSELTREAEASQLAREIDMVFGPWPGRLANYHWWWWQVESIICCRCVSDFDDEG